ncbi:transglutaminase family protein [Georgenia alba]|uniref:Transglutaminase N-terminal domain-containing protein n=1 Tax=Georgenia alba TaxID=2233858 RepID=A0ABW2Q3M5_9MICO
MTGLSTKHEDRHAHYRVRHRSTYTYPEPVTSSYGRAMLLPRDGGGQRVHHAELQVTPGPAEQEEHLDFRGNRSAYFHVASEHSRLEVVATSLVTVSRRRPALSALPSVGWEEAAAAVSAVRATGRAEQGEGPSSIMAIVEGALPSELAAPDEVVLGFALPSFHPGARLTDVVRDLAHRIHTDLDHRPGSTTVRTTPAEVLVARAGVCQDFAHLMVASLRALGLAARYVSGYVAPPGPVAGHGTGAAHAWAAVWVPGGGWVHVDPTHDRLVDHRYVVLGWGRDFLDVSPLRGVVYSARDGAHLEVAVDLETITPAELSAELG